MIRALRHLRNSMPASLSASCYDTAISVKGSSRRAVHLSGSLEEYVRLQNVLGRLQIQPVDATHLDLYERRECCHEAKATDLLFGEPEGADVGAVA